ncbi:MAG: hypothetical protein ABEJ97_04445 [Halobellus sp.]
MTASPYADRIADLAERADAERSGFEPPVSVPDKERALGYLREGFGPAVAVYLEARTGGDHVRFTASELSRLERAANDWLTLYLRCYGSDRDPDVTIREAAEVFVETHNVSDTAQLLTDVPPRHSDR